MARRLAVALFCLGAFGEANAAPKEKLVVSAAASLKPALQEIETEFEKSNPGIDVLMNFGATGALKRQIENGAEVDVFLAASADHMAALERSGRLLAGSRRNALSNSLVLIAPKGTSSPKSLLDVADSKVKRIAIGEPRSVPAGAYARESLAKLTKGTTFDSKFVLASNVRQVLAYVETGEVDAGLVYATDAKDSDKVRLVATIPTGSHEPIVYPFAILRSSKRKAEALDFLSYLDSSAARSVFEKQGFQLLAAPGAKLQGN
jgi:molybdate transport system substrate-binding protein